MPIPDISANALVVFLLFFLLGFFFYFATGALRRFTIPWHQSVEIK
jgi:hypothetical protein